MEKLITKRSCPLEDEQFRKNYEEYSQKLMNFYSEIQSEQLDKIQKLLIHELVAYKILDQNEGNIAKSIESVKKYLNFRAKYEQEKIDEQQVKSCQDSGMFIFSKATNKNHTIMIVTVAKTDNTIGHLSQLKTVLILQQDLLDLVVRKFERHRQFEETKIAVIWDRQGFDQEKHFDQKFKDIMDPNREVFQSLFSGFLQYICILQINWFFKLMFSIAQPFISQKNRNKIQLIRNNEELLQYFEPQVLKKEHGGLLSLDPSLTYESSLIIHRKELDIE